MCVQWLSGKGCSLWSGAVHSSSRMCLLLPNFLEVVQAATAILATDSVDPMASEYPCRKTSCVESVISHHRRLTVKTFRILEQVHSMCSRNCCSKKKLLVSYWILVGTRQMTMGINRDSSKTAHHGLLCVKLTKLESWVDPAGIRFKMELIHPRSAL